MEIQHVPVSGGGIPQPPVGAVVHQRGVAPANPAPAPAYNPAPADPAPQYQFQPQPTPVAPAAPAAPAVDQQLLELLQALNTKPNAPAQPTAAPVPAQPQAAPVAGQDPVITAFQAVITGSGLDYERALGRAMQEGDASLIDFAYIAERGGAKAAELRSAAEAVVARQDEIDTRLEHNVYSKFGGEANWDAAIGFFAKSVPQTTTDYIIGMLKTRNPALIEQASNMVMDHVKQAGAHLSPAVTVTGGGGLNVAQPLGKEEFKQEIAKLNPNDRGFEQARQQLFIRRHQGKQLTGR